MQDLFDRYCSFERTDADGTRYATTTRRIRVVRDADIALARELDSWADPSRIAVFFDRNTRRVGGDRLVEHLRNDGRDVTVFALEPRPGQTDVVCDDDRIDEATALLAGHWTHAIAVGAGTINDIVKMAAHRRAIPYSTLGTAPSMNGYTSSIAAILSDGVKTTQPCAPPVTAWADPAVMAAAPYRMIASGIGDLYSKPVSNADWRLSHRLLDSGYSTIVMEIVDAGSALLDGVAPRLASRDEDAVARLTGALMLSGLAMQAAGSSGPASGGEHLVSHYIDMTSAAFGESHDFHGCQVAVGTIVTSRLYAWVRAMSPASIDIDARVAALPTWDEWQEELRRRFGKLAPAVLPHAKKMYPDAAQLRNRLQRLVDQWDDLHAWVGETLRPAEDLASELQSAQCPVTFPEIDVTRERAHRAIVHAKDIRARYTILHLAADLGVLESFADALLDEQFGPSPR